MIYIEYGFMDRTVIYRVWTAVFIVSILLSACRHEENNNNPLIGKWEHKESTSGIIVLLEFSTNKISFSAEGVDPVSTSYTYVDKNTIKVKNPDTGAETKINYSINGNKLTIAFSGEDKIEYNRVK
jgi:hypothetical protein